MSARNDGAGVREGRGSAAPSPRVDRQPGGHAASLRAGRGRRSCRSARRWRTSAAARVEVVAPCSGRRRASAPALAQRAMTACEQRAGASAARGNRRPARQQSSSIADDASRLSVIRSSRRAPWAAIETWSSWLAEVGVESTRPGWRSCLFSDISAAVVTSAIMQPGVQAGLRRQERRQAEDSAGSTSIAMRRWAMAPISQTASAIMSAANATGSAWKLPPDTTRPSPRGPAGCR